MDFSKNCRLSVTDAKKIDQLSINVVKDYNKFIGELISCNKLVDQKLLTTVSCRNPLTSNILNVLCFTALFEEKVRRKDIAASVHLEDSSQVSIYSQILKKYSVKDVKISYKWHLPVGIHWLINFFKTVYIALNSFVWSRVCLSRPQDIGSFIYLDTFLLRNSISRNGSFDDRYYTGHHQHLSKDELEAIYFVPTLFGVKHPWDYIKVYRDTKRSKEKFILKERYLTFLDYIYAILFSIVLPFTIKIIPKFRDYELDKIVLRETRLDVASPALFRALCQYRFIHRLSLNKEKIIGVINWFENQVKDRALNLSLKRYYPEVIVKGYQGFMPINYYASLQPQPYEHVLESLPNELYVQNQKVIDLYSKTCKDVLLKLAPAFRFQHLFVNIPENFELQRKKVLIALPGAGMKEDTKELITSFLSIKELLGKEIDTVIKVHPTCSKEQILMLNPELNISDITFSEDSIPELIMQSNVVISSASSVCIEALAIGTPVAILGSRAGVTMNPVPDKVSKTAYKVFYDPFELKSFLIFAFGLADRISEVEKWFVKVEESNTRELFLGF